MHPGQDYSWSSSWEGSSNTRILYTYCPISGKLEKRGARIGVYRAVVRFESSLDEQGRHSLILGVHDTTRIPCQSYPRHLLCSLRQYVEAFRVLKTPICHWDHSASLGLGYHCLEWKPGIGRQDFANHYSTKSALTSSIESEHNVLTVTHNIFQTVPWINQWTHSNLPTPVRTDL